MVESASGEVSGDRPADRDGARRRDQADRRRLSGGAGRRRSERRGVVVLRGTDGVDQATDRGRRVLRRRDHHDGCQLRADAPRVLGPDGAPRRHGPQPHRGPTGLSELPALLRADLPVGQGRELARLSVEAYNDWMVDEWCGGSGGRLIPLCLVPLWDAELAAAEVRRNAARGVRAVAFSEIPAYLGLPSIHTGHWDPFFRACEETVDRHLHAHRVGHQDAIDVRRCSGGRAAPRSSSATAWRASPTSCFPVCCTVSPACS